MDDLIQSESQPKALMLTLWMALACALFLKFTLHYDENSSAPQTNTQLMQLSNTLTVPKATARTTTLREVLHLIPQAVTPAGQQGDLYVDLHGALHLHNGQGWMAVSLNAVKKDCPRM